MHVFFVEPVLYFSTLAGKSEESNYQSSFCFFWAAVHLDPHLPLQNKQHRRNHHSPTPTQPQCMFVLLPTVLPFLHLVKALLLPPFLSFLCRPSYTLLALHVCVRIQNELLMNLHKGEYQRSLAVMYTLLPRAGGTLRHGCLANILNEQTCF